MPTICSGYGFPAMAMENLAVLRADGARCDGADRLRNARPDGPCDDPRPGGVVAGPVSGSLSAIAPPFAMNSPSASDARVYEWPWPGSTMTTVAGGDYPLVRCCNLRF